MSVGLGKSKSNSQNASQQNVWNKQSPYLQDIYGQAQNLFQNPNQDTSQANDMMRSYAGSSALGDTVSGAQNALNFSLDPNNANGNPYLQGAMNAAIRPLTQNYQENVLSGITDNAVNAGQVGGTRQGVAEAIASRDYMNKVGDMTSQMSYSNYNDQMNRMGNAINQAGSVANLGMIPANIMQNIGNQDFARLGQYAGLIGGPNNLSTSTGSGSSNAWNANAGL